LFRNEKPDYEFRGIFVPKKAKKAQLAHRADLILITLLLGVNFLYRRIKIAEIFNLNSFKNIMIAIVVSEICTLF
jgi:hypothetical protein